MNRFVFVFGLLLLLMTIAPAQAAKDTPWTDVIPGFIQGQLEAFAYPPLIGDGPPLNGDGPWTGSATDVIWPEDQELGIKPNKSGADQDANWSGIGYYPGAGHPEIVVGIKAANGITFPTDFWALEAYDSSNVLIGRITGNSGVLHGQNGAQVTTTGTFGGIYRPVWMVINTTTHTTEFFLDGHGTGATSIGSLAYPGGGNTLGKLRFLSFAATSSVGQIWLDNLVYGTLPGTNPTVTAPIGGVTVGTLTPTVTWTRHTVDAAINHQVRICSSDDPEATVIYDSGTVAGSDTSAVTGSLPQSAHLWAFVREETPVVGWGGWSASGNGGFYITVAPPAAPTITAPTGATGCRRPLIRFHGADVYSHVWIKIFSSNVADPETATPSVFNTGDLTSSSGTCECTTILADGTYYTFAKIENAGGWSQWSAGHSFTVSQSLAVIDIRHMNEPNILTTDVDGPNDGFGHLLNSQYADGPGYSTIVSVTAPVCGNAALQWSDTGPSRSIRTHKIGTATDFTGIDLDNGVTFAFAVAVQSEGGGDGGGASWRMANALLIDKQTDGGDSHFIAIRTLPTGVGIITDNDKAAMPTGQGYTYFNWTPSADYRMIRVTGRNQVAGDYTSTLWKVYVDENPMAVLTATGSLTASVLEPDLSTWYTDAIALGHGSVGSTGVIDFDWTAVNGSGDYAPGEWSPFSGMGAYASIGAAKQAGAEARPVSISGGAGGVITKVIMDATPAQIGYYVQDVASGFNASGVYVSSSNTTNIAVGNVVTTLSGVIEGQASGQAIVDPSVTISGTADVIPASMSQKSLMSPCIGQGLGSRMDTCAMMVKVFGKVKLSNIDYTLFNGVGGYVLYVDDGSGAIDGREVDGDGNPYPGIRRVIRADDPDFPGASIGDYAMIQGIAGYETATLPDLSTAVVRQILYPTVTILASGV